MSKLGARFLFHGRRGRKQRVRFAAGNKKGNASWLLPVSIISLWSSPRQSGLLVSTAWYTLFSRIAAAPLDAGPKQPAKAFGAAGASLPNVVAILGYVVMAFTLAGLVGHLGPGQVTVANGIVSGGFVWFGFVLTTMTVNYSYSGQSRRPLVIHAGNWLVVLVVIGAVIGEIGV